MVPAEIVLQRCWTDRQCHVGNPCSHRRCGQRNILHLAPLRHRHPQGMRGLKCIRYNKLVASHAYAGLLLAKENGGKW